MMMALGYVVMCRRPKAVKFGQNCKILAKNCKVVHPIKKGREESREFSKTQKIGTNFSNSFHFSRKSSFKQCDQIGPFLERLGNKISFKSGPNFWWLLGLFQTTSFLVKNVRGYFLVNFVNKYWATFSNILSHWFRTKKFVHFFSLKSFWQNRDYFLRLRWKQKFQKKNFQVKFYLNDTELLCFLFKLAPV